MAPYMFYIRVLTRSRKHASINTPASRSARRSYYCLAMLFDHFVTVTSIILGDFLVRVVGIVAISKISRSVCVALVLISFSVFVSGGLGIDSREASNRQHGAACIVGNGVVEMENGTLSPPVPRDTTSPLAIAPT